MAMQDMTEIEYRENDDREKYRRIRRVFFPGICYFSRSCLLIAKISRLKLLFSSKTKIFGYK